LGKTVFQLRITKHGSDNASHRTWRQPYPKVSQLSWFREVDVTKIRLREEGIVDSEIPDEGQGIWFLKFQHNKQKPFHLLGYLMQLLKGMNVN
jgi:hypothetical protein